VNRSTQKVIARLLLVVCAAWLLPPPGAIAQPAAEQAEEIYRIGAGDVLRLNVPQRADLDAELTVQKDGTIYVTPVGEVVVVDLTLEEAEEVLTRRLGLYDPAIQEVVLGVMEYNALRVFVLGAVNSPGSYTFEAPPTLWEVLRAAGGPAETANLATARVITVEDGRPRSTTVNLSGYLSGGTFPENTLQGGDTLVVPSIADGAVGVPSSAGVQVFGGVAQPTTVPIEQPTDLLTVLMLAGAPLDNANLEEIDWVRRPGGSRDTARRVNVAEYLRDGRLDGNPTVYPGDVVYVNVRRESWLRSNLPLFFAFLTSMATLLLAYDRLTEE